MKVDVLNTFDDTKGILYVNVKGTTNLEDLLNELSYLETNDVLPRHLKILEDARNVTITFSEEELNVVISKIEMVLKKYSSIRHAVVHNDALNTAYAMIVSAMTRKRKYQLEVFSTPEAAKGWLDSFASH